MLGQPAQWLVLPLECHLGTCNRPWAPNFIKSPLQTITVKLVKSQFNYIYIYIYCTQNIAINMCFFYPHENHGGYWFTLEKLVAVKSWNVMKTPFTFTIFHQTRTESPLETLLNSPFIPAQRIQPSHLRCARKGDAAGAKRHFAAMEAAGYKARLEPAG